MNWTPRIVSLLIPAMLAGCGQVTPGLSSSFGDDVRKLSTSVFTIVLTDNQGQARVAVVPKFQGRVMTATAGGADGTSTGIIHHAMIAGARTMPKFSSVGGEERLTLGPEGGQYGLFFPGGADFTAENYQAPAALDSEPFDIVERAADKVTLSKKFTLTNYANKYFQLKVTRTVKLLPEAAAWKQLGATAPDGVSIVAYETDNTLANFSKTPWRKEEGAISISTVHSVPASDAIVIIPIREPGGPGTGTKTPAVTGDYSGSIPFERLSVSPRVVVLRSGATVQRIGIKPSDTMGIMGVYDIGARTLTIVQFMPFSPGAPYTDGHWKILKEPYAGDAAIASAGGGTVELQTFSPALELGAWDSATHVSRTFHISGSVEALNKLSMELLGTGLEGIGSK